MAKLASIIIVTYNREKIVLDCLKSVMNLDYKNTEIILVDNASSDQTVNRVKKEYPLVKVIRNKTNLGLNTAKNLGQKHSKGEYILFLDSDTYVHKKMLSAMLKLAESSKKIGIICPKMYYFKPKDVIWYAGSSVNLLTSQTKNWGCNQKDKGQFDQVYQTQFAPTAYLASRELVDKLKGHSGSLFMSYGDTDYGFRAKNLGFQIVFCPQAKLWHKITMQDNTNTIRSLGYNARMRAYYFARNRVIFMKKHAPKLNFFIFLIIFFPAFTLYISAKIIAYRGWKFLLPHWQGSWDGLVYAVNNRLINRWQ